MENTKSISKTEAFINNLWKAFLWLLAGIFYFAVRNIFLVISTWSLYQEDYLRAAFCLVLAFYFKLDDIYLAIKKGGK